MEREVFCKRLVQLRMNKGVSARDMSLSIGQSPNYIIGIEGGKNYPSMETFFYICDYFGHHSQGVFRYGLYKSGKNYGTDGNCQNPPQ